MDSDDFYINTDMIFRLKDYSGTFTTTDNWISLVCTPNFVVEALELFMLCDKEAKFIFVPPNLTCEIMGDRNNLHFLNPFYYQFRDRLTDQPIYRAMGKDQITTIGLKCLKECKGDVTPKSITAAVNLHMPSFDNNSKENMTELVCNYLKWRTSRQGAFFDIFKIKTLRSISRIPAGYGSSVATNKFCKYVYHKIAKTPPQFQERLFELLVQTRLSRIQSKRGPVYYKPKKKDTFFTIPEPATTELSTSVLLFRAIHTHTTVIQEKYDNISFHVQRCKIKENDALYTRTNLLVLFVAEISNIEQADIFNYYHGFWKQYMIHCLSRSKEIVNKKLYYVRMQIDDELEQSLPLKKKKSKKRKKRMEKKPKESKNGDKKIKK